MDASPLAKLPPELRNNIYEEVLVQKDTVKLTFKPAKEHVKSRVLLRETGSQRQLLALTFTCKLLRRETHDLFFAINSFEIYASSFVFASRSCKASIPIHCFLDSVTTLSARLAIERLTLNIGEYEPNRYGNHNFIPAMVMDLKRNLLTAYPCLPLKVRASIYGVGAEHSGEDPDLEIDMQNLASSVGDALEQVKEMHQETQDEEDVVVDYDDNDDNENYRRGFRLDRLRTLIDELDACLQLQAGTLILRPPRLAGSFGCF
ncbi:hypothetical protein KC318_g3280 [Hortaea werneckii]|nr:hypothetical protein KC334_g3646 [Hortaea werneckii]KAI7018208.1 hypothetical protein KC355_g3424 [Hortaea werneckii]KAI7671773.1 hypothetical protein KC318_g3280 [Hortaea werneckii]